MPASSKLCHSVRVSQTNICTVPFPVHATYPSYLIVWCLKQYFVNGRDYVPPHNIISSFLRYLPLLAPRVILSTLISNTLSLCSSLLVRDEVSHPFKTTCRVIVLCILIFTFFVSKLDGRCFWTKWYQAFPKCHLFWIAFWLQFWYVRFVHKYLNFATFKGFVTCVYVLWFCAAFCSWNRMQHKSINIKWSAVISSVYGIGLERRMLGKILYVFDKVMP
jgi:hypothetical protein